MVFTNKNPVRITLLAVCREEGTVRKSCQLPSRTLFQKRPSDPLEGQFLVQQWDGPKHGLSPSGKPEPLFVQHAILSCWCFPFRPTLWGKEQRGGHFFCFVSWKNAAFSHVRGQAEKEEAGNNDPMVVLSAHCSVMCWGQKSTAVSAKEEFILGLYSSVRS